MNQRYLTDWAGDFKGNGSGFKLRSLCLLILLRISFLRFDFLLSPRHLLLVLLPLLRLSLSINHSDRELDDRKKDMFFRMALGPTVLRSFATCTAFTRCAFVYMEFFVVCTLESWWPQVHRFLFGGRKTYRNFEVEFINRYLKKDSKNFNKRFRVLYKWEMTVTVINI